MPVQPAGAVRTLLTGTVRDVRFSADGSLLYASTGQTIVVVNVATGATVAEYDLGTQIGAIDLSADGQYLAATPNFPGSFSPASSSANFFRINLATGVVETFSFATTWSNPASLIGGEFMDVVQLGGNRVMLTQQTSNGLIVVDLNGPSPVVSTIAASSSAGAFLEASADRQDVLVLGLAKHHYVDGTGIVGSIGYDPYAGASVPDGRPANSNGAFSPSSDLVLIDGTALNDALVAQPSIQSQIRPFISSPVFSADGTRVYSLVSAGIAVFDTATWNVLAVYSLGQYATGTTTRMPDNTYVFSGYGDTLELSGDGRYLSVITLSGAIVLDLQLAVSVSTSGDDDLRGTLGTQIGLAGNDLLGGTGGTSLYGGPGNDQYYIGPSSIYISEYADEGIDSVYFETTNFTVPINVENATALSTAATNLFGNTGDNVLTGNIGNDFLIGYDGADTISGGAGADRIEGGTGADQLDGGDDADVILGGAGGDTIFGGDGADEIGTDGQSYSGIGTIGDDLLVEIDFVDAGAGDDKVWIGYGDSADGGAGFDSLSISFYFAPGPVSISAAEITAAGIYANGAGSVQGFEALVRVVGSQYSDMIEAGAAAMTIEGSGGDDTVIRGLGTIRFDGGNGLDTVDYSAYSQAISIDLSTLGQGQGPGGDTLWSVEGLVGTAFNDYLKGTFSNDQLFGGDGDDVLLGSFGTDYLNGGLGNDQLNGGDGDDSLYGGSGGDLLEGGIGTDTASYAGSSVGVNVNLGTGLGSGGQAEGDTLISIENLIGSNLADVLIGNSFANRLIGVGGIDTLNGMGGSDQLTVSTAGSGTNIDGGSGTDTLVILGSVTLGSLAGIEAVELNSGSNLMLTANQAMTGLAFNNAFRGSGTVTIQMGGAVLLGIAGFQGAATNPGITFTIDGTVDSDYIKGSQFANTILGGAGQDQLRGGNGVDTIDGGTERDKIVGWGGADVLTGGEGGDQFRYLFATDSGIGAAADRITDFTIGSDVIDFRLLDSDVGTPDIQNYAFSFIGTAAFAVGGGAQVRYADSGANLLVQMDLDGNGSADMEIVLQGLAGQTLSAGGFLLVL